jgi:hypothetical protein
MTMPTKTRMVDSYQVRVSQSVWDHGFSQAQIGKCVEIFIDDLVERQWTPRQGPQAGVVPIYDNERGHFVVLGVIPSMKLIGLQWLEEAPQNLHEHVQESIAILKDELLREAPVSGNA